MTDFICYLFAVAATLLYLAGSALIILVIYKILRKE